MENMPKAKKKILKTGKYTYMITLPKEWVKTLKWRAKQMVELELVDESIVVRDSKSSNT